MCFGEFDIKLKCSLTRSDEPMFLVCPFLFLRDLPCRLCFLPHSHIVGPEKGLGADFTIWMIDETWSTVKIKAYLLTAGR